MSAFGTWLMLTSGSSSWTSIWANWRPWSGPDLITLLNSITQSGEYPTCPKTTRQSHQSRDPDEGRTECLKRTPYLLSIEHYLLELTRLSEALDDFSRNIRSQVNAEGQSNVSRLHQIPQLLRALQLQGIMGNRSLTGQHSRVAFSAVTDVYYFSCFTNSVG